MRRPAPARIFRLLGLLALMACWPQALPAQEADPEILGLLLARAETLQQAGDAEAALEVLDRLLSRTDSITADSPDPLPLLLQRALVARGTVHWQLGQRGGTDDDFDRLIELDPAFDLAAEQPPEDLLNRFNRRRERLVGFLRVGISPADADVYVDGVAIEDGVEIVPVLGGDHVVRAERRGFAPIEEAVSVRANRTEGVGLVLERSSATVQVATNPPGATVVLDGEVVGTTAPAADGPASAPLVVEGLLPGFHDIEITLADHRPFRQTFEVPDLTDYDLGTLEMRLALGTLTLGGMPVGADLRINGDPFSDYSTVGSGAIRLQLPVGRHQIVVGAPGGRAWRGQVDMVDGGTLTRTVELAPAIGFLGVAGGDALDRDAATDALTDGFSAHPGWQLLDRRDVGALLSATEALDLGSGAQEELRCRFEDEIPAALFVVGVIDPEDPGRLTIHTWATGADLAAARMTVPRGDRELLSAALDRLLTPLPVRRPWHGLVLVDTPLGPLVAAVGASSPAERAGFTVGDRIVSVAGAEATTVADFGARAGAAGAQADLPVRASLGGQERELYLRLDSSPHVSSAPDDVVAVGWWAQAEAAVAAGGVLQPQWALYLQQAVLLIDAGRLDAAADMLFDAAAPADSPFGQAAVDYWLGVALADDEETLGAARNALNRAAGIPGARLYHNDGPFIGPRARARIARIAARMRY